MTKLQKLLTAICSVICLTACIFTLVFYFCFKNPKSSTSGHIEIQNIVVFQGQSTKIIYEVADKNCTVKFSVSDESVAKVVDNDEIVGLTIGETFLSAKVKSKKQEYSALAIVKVIARESGNGGNNNNNKNDNNIGHDELDENYKDVRILITPNQNCIYQDSVLYVKKNCIFDINVYGDYDYSTALNFTVHCSDGLAITKEFNFYYLTAQNDGKLYIEIEKANMSFTLDVILYD